MMLECQVKDKLLISLLKRSLLLLKSIYKSKRTVSGKFCRIHRY